jgi:hypothetical protein
MLAHPASVLLPDTQPFGFIIPQLAKIVTNKNAKIVFFILFDFFLPCPTAFLFGLGHKKRGTVPSLAPEVLDYLCTQVPITAHAPWASAYSRVHLEIV